MDDTYIYVVRLEKDAWMACKSYRGKMTVTHNWSEAWKTTDMTDAYEQAQLWNGMPIRYAIKEAVSQSDYEEAKKLEEMLGVDDDSED